MQKICGYTNLLVLIRDVLRLCAYILLPLGLVVLSMLVPVRDLFLFYGNAALVLLVYLLFLKPASVLVPLPLIRLQLAYRRQVGVAAFWLALFHSVMFVYSNALTSASDYSGLNNYLFYGLWAMCGMIILGVTSNDMSVRFFKSYWQRVHYLAYPTLFFTLMHVGMVKGELGIYIFVGSVYIVLRLLAWRGVCLYPCGRASNTQ